MNRAGPLRVGIHRFETYRGHPGRDGANIAYDESIKLLAGCPDIILELHDIVGIFADYDYARHALGKCDVIVAAVGPHAYIYFYLRERFNLNFRIIRDVRTALWNGYLLQEVLVAPYLRPDDSVIHSSAYSRDLFRRIIPSAYPDTQHVCYPLMNWFPRDLRHSATRDKERGREYIIGYAGRLTLDKNFFQALDLLAVLHRRHPGRFRLCAVGEGKPPFGSADAVRRLGPAIRSYQWRPPVPPADIWQQYAAFDALFFPSTSTLETFGRVLAEALASGLPVLASSHGACSELLAPAAQLPTRYVTDRMFTTHLAAPLASVDIDEAADRFSVGVVTCDDSGLRAYRNDAARYLSIVIHGSKSDTELWRVGTSEQSRFLARLEMRGLTPLASIADADAAISRLRHWFLALHREGASYPLTLLELLLRSRYRRKTLQFIGRSIRLGEDFTNIGGIDLQLSHLIRFYPSFQLRRNIGEPGGHEDDGARTR